MVNIREILVNNIKENRKKLSFSQAKLAEKAETSTQYIAMIEVSRKFPSPKMLERIAKSLEIEAYELFMVKLSPEGAMQQPHDTLARNIERVASEAIEKAVADKLKADLQSFHAEIEGFFKSPREGIAKMQSK